MDTVNFNQFKNHRMRKLVFGLLVIVAGAMLIGFNTGFLPDEYRNIVFSWQMLLIGLGIVSLFSRDSWVPGVILILIGGFFMAPLLYQFDFEFQRIFWPALLILLGLLIIFKRRTRRPGHFGRYEKVSEYHLESGYIDESNIFSGNKHIIPPGEFKGGKISCIFGGSEIDLSQTTLPEGKSILEIECIFGGVSMIVPSDWKVQIAVKSVMGGFSDKRRIISTNGNKGELIIKGEAIFGGGEIKSV